MGAVIVSFLASRLAFLSINPIAVAMFVLAYAGKRNKNKCMLAIVLGIISCAVIPVGNFEVSDITKYMLIFACIMTIDKMAVRQGVYLNKMRICIMAGIITMFIGIAGGFFNIWETLILSVGEGILVVIFTQILEKGMYLVECHKDVDTLSNEQLISIVILIVASIGGIYEPKPELFSISEGLLYLFVLYMGEKYGAAAGALAGVGAGGLWGIRGNDAIYISLFSLVGIAVGIMRKAGKWAGLLIYVLSGLFLALLYPSKLWNAVTFRGFVSAGVIFAIIPASYMLSREDEKNENSDDMLEIYSIKNQAGYKLRQFSEAFAKLSESFSEEYGLVPANGTELLFNRITEGVCSGCSNCNVCWQNRYYDTYNETIKIIGAGSNGPIMASDIPVDFAMKCIQVDRFMLEANRQLELSRVNYMWQSRINRNRMLMAGQMKETARLIKGLEEDIAGISRVSMDEENELYNMLKAFGIRAKKLVISKRRDGQYEVIVRMKAAGNNCITYREIADMIGGVLGDRWCVSEGFGNTVSKEYTTVSFIKDVNYRILTGVARTAKAGESVSGDNYSFMRLSGGKVIMTITDGMGSGLSAYKESEKVIELIEQLVQAGFREDMALRIVNSTLLIDEDKDDFSTVDICVIDLNNASCRCMKYGAAATFIRKKDMVKVIESNALPIGIMPDIESEENIYSLNDGDFIIMLSDGITDSFGENPHGAICDLVSNMNTGNPQELADRILSEALNCNRHQAKDDMSVLVAGIWAK